MKTIKRKNPKYVDQFVDRFGVARFYFRRKGGPRIALPGLPWSPEFMEAYQAALIGQGLQRASNRVEPGSIGAALVSYYEATASGWSELSPVSRKFRKSILEQFRDKYAGGKIRAVTRHQIADIIAIRNPSAQGNWMKALRHFFNYAVAANMIEHNPTTDVKTKKKPKTDGFRPWEESDVTRFRDFYPLGTLPRLAMEIMLNLGVRVSDAAQIGPSNIKDGALADYRPQKGRATNGHKIDIPLHDDLLHAIAATPLIGGPGSPYLRADRGGTFNAEYLSQRMRDWADAAGLPDCTSHGLRKLACIRLAEKGCTEREIMAVTGHKSSKEVQTYCAAADRKKLAAQAIARLA